MRPGGQPKAGAESLLKTFNKGYFIKKIYRAVALTVTVLFSVWSCLHAEDIRLYGNLKPGSVLIIESEGMERVSIDEKKLGVYNGVSVTGFDRDESGSRLIKVEYKDGRRFEKKYALQDREYEVQSITGLPESHVLPSREDLERAAGEREKFSQSVKESGQIEKIFFEDGFMRPVEGGRITGVFGSKRVLNEVPGSPHNGVDIALPEGAPVYASAGGRGLLTGDFFYGGKNVMLGHGQGLLTFYLHLSKIDVEEGQKVEKGDKIGEVGMTGRATGPHLHWGAQWKDRRIDPDTLLDTHFGEEPEYRIKVFVSRQKIELYRDEEKLKSYPVSTSRYGTGSEAGSYKTPLGLHRIASKIGEDAPEATVFRGRVNQNRQVPIYEDDRRSDEDLVLTRILRLEGLEPGRNRGEGIDSYDRFIYIHGTQEEGLIGRPASRGCIRMKNRDVMELFDKVEEGTFVEIIE